MIKVRLDNFKRDEFGKIEDIIKFYKIDFTAERLVKNYELLIQRTIDPVFNDD